jgi:hypothetical protein
MTTKREYAISLGLATPGRGRLSREAHAAIDKAISEGKTFSDAKPVVTKAPKTAKSVSVVTEDEAPEFRETVYRYPIDTVFVGEDTNGKKFKCTARAACMCGYSLVAHICNDPRVVNSNGTAHISVRAVV